MQTDQYFELNGKVTKSPFLPKWRGVKSDLYVNIATSQALMRRVLTFSGRNVDWQIIAKRKLNSIPSLMIKGTFDKEWNNSKVDPQMR